LEDYTGTHDDSEHKHRPSTTQSLAYEKGDDGTSEASQIVYRGDKALHGRRRVIEILDKVLANDDAAEDT